MARGISLFLGGVLALATLAARHRPALDLAVWCVDVRPLPRALRLPVIAVAAALLVAFALRPAAARWRRRATLVVLALLGALALHDSATFYALWHAGRFHPGAPLPLSLIVAGALAVVAWRVARRAPRPHPDACPRADAFRHHRAPTRTGAGRRVAIAAIACALTFPIAQMLCFGRSDYRRPADAALVFGARAYADGRPSQALEDRVRTACALYRQGLVHTLILSGGAGDGAVSEPEAMRGVALAEGVPDAALRLDGAGTSTEASVDDARAIAVREGIGRVIAVSHAYHLPRIKLELQRAHLDAVTVPARERHVLAGMPWFVAREVVAWWLHALDLSV